MLYIAEQGDGIRRDVNLDREKAFRLAAAEARKHFVECGNEQLHLQILGTHPDHRRHGYGKLLCEWGMKRAAEEGLVVTVVAGSNGEHLYRYLGFKCLGSVMAKLPGEEDQVEGTAMIFTPGEIRHPISA